MEVVHGNEKAIQRGVQAIEMFEAFDFSDQVLKERAGSTMWLSGSRTRSSPRRSCVTVACREDGLPGHPHVVFTRCRCMTSTWMSCEIRPAGWSRTIPSVCWMYSPVRRYTRPDQDVDAVFDVRAIFPPPHDELDIASIPALLLPRKGATACVIIKKASLQI
jgi:hypothetical protein